MPRLLPSSRELTRSTAMTWRNNGISYCHIPRRTRFASCWPITPNLYEGYASSKLSIEPYQEMIEIIARLAIPPAVTSILSATVQEDRATETVDIRVLSVIKFMQNNLEKRLALKEMAHLVGLSDSRFRHLFTAETGMSPRACLRKLRLCRAKLLLEEDLLTIDQIALGVGWQHRSHFERRFKQLYGTTPAQYRKMRRINLLQKKVAAAVSATD